MANHDNGRYDRRDRRTYDRQQNRRQQSPLIETQIVEGILKGIWFLITLPFKKRGGSASRRPGLVSARDAKEFADNWEVVKLYARSENTYAMAISEADKLLDNALMTAGHPGNTMADRLKASSNIFDQGTYNGIWEAHKLRNRLAHEIGVRVDHSQLQTALHNFQQGLRALGVFL